MPIIDTPLEKESRDRYLTYALSVISSRALPDVRDGLKPVQRRILFDMFRNLRLVPGGSHRKSAAVVGGVIARFHPHGDVACYEAMVRMAQDFSLRYPLVDGQGNFGSIDGDGPAAYRYTEVKLREMALEVLGEIDQETVPFRDNFDGTQSEPIVLPSRVPNFLMNGAMGIAVGMATSVPPHNLKDLVKALLELCEDPEISIGKLVTAIKGPDFPTGCSILNTREELVEIYKTGRGPVRMRGEWAVEEGKRGKKFIIINTIPYGIDKSQLVECIADCIIQKKLPQLSDIRDESTEKIRVVLELTSDADPEVAMAYLFKNTPLESTFQVNLTALVPVKGSDTCKPELLSLKTILQHFLDFRHEVVEKRLKFERKNLNERIHILEGFVIIYDALDEVIKIVRKSEGRQDAAEKLRKRFKLSEIQSYAIVDMRIYQISKTSIEEIRAELTEKEKRVAEIDAILKSKKKITDLVKKDLNEVSEKYGDKRRSSLVRDNIEIEFNEADYVVKEEVYAIVTQDGWLKRIRQSNDVAGTRLREGDKIIRAHPISTLDSVAIFTNMGNLFVLKCMDFPASSGFGDPIQKLLKFRDGEAIVDSFAIKASLDSGDGKDAEKSKGKTQGELFAADANPYAYNLRGGDTVILVSKCGTGFALKLDTLDGVKRNGRRVMKLREGDTMRGVCIKKKRVLFVTQHACGLIIESSEIPERDTAAVGVNLIGVRDDDNLVGALSFEGQKKFKVIQEGGKVKEVSSGDITSGRRGLKGTKIVPRGDVFGVEFL